jgi:hypothetical protein
MRELLMLRTKTTTFGKGSAVKKQQRCNKVMNVALNGAPVYLQVLLWPTPAEHKLCLVLLPPWCGGTVLMR